MTTELIIALLGIVAAIVVFSVLSYKGVHTYISVIVAGFIVIFTSSLDPTVSFNETFWPNFNTLLNQLWWLCIGGALFGAVVNMTGAGVVCGRAILKLMGKRATLGLAIVGVVLQLCGVSIFSGALFAMLPMIFAVFKEYDIPRRFAPAIICFSVLTLACVMPGSIATHNLLTTQFFGLTLYAGAVNGFVAFFVMLFLGDVIINKLIKKAQANGEHFEALPGDFPAENAEGETKEPPLWRVLIPMVLFPVVINFAPWDMFFSQLIVFGVSLVCLWGYWTPKTLIASLREVVPMSLNVILGMAAITGFGSFIFASPAFKVIIGLVMKIPGNALVSAAIATTILAGACGSASSAISIVLPVLGNTWAATGITTAGLARVVGLSSLVLDSLPHNGAINGLLLGCREPLKKAYPPIFWMTVVVPAVGTVVLVILFSIFPNLP